jgi:ribose/xylose/arabinose/galactoside ABC-type transport system permease subunit/acetyl esterase/lipase
MTRIDLSFMRRYAVVFVLLALVVLFSFVTPYFLTWRNLANIVSQNSYFVIVAVGMAFVLISGGIDLSVGYQMSLVGVVTALLMTTYQWPVWLAVVTGIALGTGLGLVNGLVVVKIKTFPLIVTLATSVIFMGISYSISQSRTFRAFPESFRWIAHSEYLGVGADVYLALIVVLAAAFVFYQTRWGSRIVALGGSEEALRRAGVNTQRLKVFMYTACGFLTAIATMDMLSKADSMQSSFGPGTEFTALTAAIVGGVSFMGGEGNIPALVAGVFVLAVLGNGMQLAGWGIYAQYIVRGVILLGAVAFDDYQKSMRSRSLDRPIRGGSPMKPDEKPETSPPGPPLHNGPGGRRPGPPPGAGGMPPRPPLDGNPGGMPPGPPFRIPQADVSGIRRKWLDLPYADASPAQTLDLYVPDEGEGPFPVIVHIHGGAFAIGDKREIMLTPYLRGLDHGYAVASLNYRLSGEATFPAGLQDLKAAVRWLRRHADEYRLDPDRFAACGGSAGGNYAAMLALTPERAEFDDPSLGELDRSCAVQACVDWFGPTDFLKMDAQLAESGLGPCDHCEAESPESRYLGAKITEVPDRVRQANPITYVDADAPPFLIQHGRSDNLVPYQQSAELAQTLAERAGADKVQFDIIEGAGHVDPLFDTEANLERVFGFLDRHLN